VIPRECLFPSEMCKLLGRSLRELLISAHEAGISAVPPEILRAPPQDSPCGGYVVASPNSVNTLTFASIIT
jgi:hypothetical protein